MQEELLIKHARSGNQQAIRVLVERYKHHVFKVAYGVVRDERLAEDLAQETFIKMMDALPGYRSEGFKTWLSRIALNKAIDHKRKEARRKEDLSDSTYEQTIHISESAEQEMLQKESIRNIRRHLDGIPKNFQGVVKAYYLDGKSYEEIAQTFDLAEKTVEMRLYRARKWMKHNWKEENF
ncbi:RNA polymerase sigma factor [Thalassobacillus hwangdonensis]|uniref:RNA polymerase sigma factor n=1 Tax=Thalassobacillus hwangdonensis TaxID=546108 RepID=A0ABW3L455_9BACI